MFQPVSKRSKLTSRPPTQMLVNTHNCNDQRYERTVELGQTWSESGASLTHCNSLKDEEKRESGRWQDLHFDAKLMKVCWISATYMLCANEYGLAETQSCRTGTGFGAECCFENVMIQHLEIAP